MPVMNNGIEAAALMQVEEKKLDITDMKMLRMMSGVTRLDRMRNDYSKGSVKIIEISRIKMQEARLRCFGHPMRRNDEEIGREAMDMEIPGTRRKGRSRIRWKDCVNADMREEDLDQRDAKKRTIWRRQIRNSDPE
ncbi:uncharacterized protein LOC134763198 [Penaeus indicus]|uniref:uncharacterized protein LOC134763198 n=1 Tax=Penaeus indicus TaxID=29960 RepID=UPI00300D496D